MNENEQKLEIFAAAVKLEQKKSGITSFIVFCECNGGVKTFWDSMNPLSIIGAGQVLEKVGHSRIPDDFYKPADK